VRRAASEDAPMVASLAAWHTRRVTAPRSFAVASCLALTNAQYLLGVCFRYVPLHPGAMDGIPLPPGLGGTVDPLESVLGPFPCVRLRGLPFDATLEDVLVFFQGLGVLDVVLKGSGDAFVVLGNTMDYQMALQR
jgi:hypothetical protein